ncbi:MAG: PucR family transcriptional regulator [Oscillospiraceae bacterium]
MKNKLQFDENTLYKRLYEYMVGGDMGLLLRFAHEIWGMPVSSCDAHYNLLGMYPKTCIDDVSYDSYVQNGKVSEDLVQGFMEEQYMVSIMTSEEPYVIDWGFIRTPRAVFRLMEKETFYGAISIVLSGGYQWGPEDSALLKIIAASATQILARRRQSVQHSESVREWLFSALLQNREMGVESLNKVYASLDIAESELLQVLHITPVAQAQPFFADYFKRQMLMRFAGHPICAITGSVYVLLHHANALGLEQLLKQVEAYLNYQQGLLFAASEVFSGIKAVAAYRLQADFALTTGAQKGDKAIFLYKKYVLDHEFSTLGRQLPLHCTIPKELKVLLEYDRRNNTPYAETLRVYLYNFLNSNKTFLHFGIHRNTLLHRLNQIEQLAEISLNDENMLLRLLLAFKIIDACEIDEKALLQSGG